jgi:HK97 family phage prohead protease
MRTLDTKLAKLEIKSLSDDGVFVGMASVYGNRDLQDDIVMPGAFTRWLGGAASRTVPLFYQHDPKMTIGKGEVFGVPGRGLGIRGTLVLEVQAAREAHALLKKGAISGLSIGYNVLAREWDGDVRKLTELELFEVSVVSTPANPAATVSLSTVKRREEALRTDRLTTLRAGMAREQAARAIAQAARDFRRRLGGQ